MMLIKALDTDFDTVKSIVTDTIETVYPNYYPRGAVDFFLRHHSDDAIKKAITGEAVYLIKAADKTIGTGSIEKNEIQRLFVLPKYQGSGYGTAIMNELEKIIFKNHTEIVLNSSLPAYEMYLRRGYVSMEYHRMLTENGHYLCYHIMKKKRSRTR